MNGFDVGRYIFPYSAVASGKSLNQAAIFVNKIHGKAINFKFRNIFHGVYTKAFLHPAVKIPKFIGTESIGQAQHRLAETDFSKIVGCFAPYLWVGESGVTSLDIPFPNPPADDRGGQIHNP